MVFKRKLEELFRQFDQLSSSDSKLRDEETEVYWFYCGIRPWAPVAGIERGNKAKS